MTVYLDNASATKLDERVLDAMRPYLFEVYAVATSEFGYSLGIEAKEALDTARANIAKRMNGNPDELVFTSGSTESSNLALKGIIKAFDTKKSKKSKKHIIVSTIEDFPVLNSAKTLEKQGVDVTFVPVDETGLVDIEQLKESFTDNTVLVSIQHANQEIGTIQDIKTIGEFCSDHGVLFHTDATHTFTRVPLDVTQIPVDLVTVSAHTIHGPKGVGALYIKEGTPITKVMDGGFQENNMRAGLENIPGAVGFSKAVDLVTDKENQQIQNMRDTLIDKVLTEIPHTTLNGHPKKRTPHNANITFHYVEGESITLHLDMRGFAVSTGSACFSRSLEASHVIMGIGGDHERAHGSVRFTFGRFNTMKDVDAIVTAVSEVVKSLRDISPLGKSGGD